MAIRSHPPENRYKRYEQSHRIPFAGSNSSYDGAAEVWLENEAALAALRKSPEYLNGALADEPNFIDMSRVEWLVTKDHVMLDGPQTPQQVKSIFLLKRQAGMSLADYRKYWLEVHGPIVCKLPGLQRYVQHGKRTSRAGKPKELREVGNRPAGQLAFDFHGVFAGIPS